MGKIILPRIVRMYSILSRIIQDMLLSIPLDVAC